jgi:transcriptional antiterminator RfaH
MPKTWIVARTKPCREVWAAENIQRQGHEFYLPRIFVPATHLCGQARSECLFKSYIFVLTEQWRFLLSTFGVSGVIMGGNGSGPAILPQSEIDRMKLLEDGTGFVILPKFKPGQDLRVTDGPFKNEKAIYQGMGPKEREEVLINFLGRKTKVLIAKEFLEAA